MRGFYRYVLYVRLFLNLSENAKDLELLKQFLKAKRKWEESVFF